MTYTWNRRTPGSFPRQDAPDQISYLTVYITERDRTLILHALRIAVEDGSLAGETDERALDAEVAALEHRLKSAQS